MRIRRFMAIPIAVVLLAGACGGDDDDDDAAGDDNAATESGGGEDTGSVNILSAVEPEEAEVVQGVLDSTVNDDADYTAEIEASGDFEEQFEIRAEGGTLDIALLPQPGQVAAAVDQGAVALEDMGFEVDQLTDQFGDYLMSLVEVDGKHYGMPTNVNLKSMVWYPKDDFDAAGYEVPDTWDDLLALSDQIVADGSTPWCVGYESEGATGWPATDWMEDIMLRTAGPDTYDQWVNHEIPFNDPAVLTATERFGEIMFGDGYVLGGADQTPSIAFGDAPGPMFEDPPNCWLHRQASFINAFFPAEAEAGVDYDWFPFPEIDQQATLIAGEFAVAFRDAPEVRDFLEQFAGEEVQCGMGGETGSSRLSPNLDVEADCYANEILADSSEIVSAALEDGTARFDASDQMPPEVGSGSFWTGMMTYMQEGPDSAEGVLGDIEASWPT
ncbi:MAG TPA: ABC transporter substrate-binding protein [Acidimicrobiales bacterium]|nr:ABC transporter substrate-binding protein [Acidimicrobiales bacterium]